MESPRILPTVLEFAASKLRRYELALRATICLGFLSLCTLYLYRSPMIMDEFANAKHVMRVFESVPYRDYTPYKTLLGYLIVAPGLYSSADSWDALIQARLWLALLVTGTVFVLGGWMTKRWGAAASLGAIVLLATNTTFLERNWELRVDMLAAIFGAFSLMMLVDGRFRWSGVLVALSFLCTQKGVYFGLASGSALLAHFGLLRTKEAFRAGLEFAVTALLTLVVYAGIAFLLGEPERVWQSLFGDPKKLALGHLYVGLDFFWLQSFERNPVSYGLGLAGLVLSWPSKRAPNSQRLLPLYGASLAVLCGLHKQPWPYFLVFVHPTMCVLSAAALSRFQRSYLAPLMGCVVVYGGLSAMWQRVPTTLERSAAVHEQVVRAGHALVAPNEEYFAGTEMLIYRRHATTGSWIDAHHLRLFLQHPEWLIDAWEAHPPKVIIDNYRVWALPDEAKAWISENYVRRDWQFHCYAPRVSSAERVVPFGVASEYVVRSKNGAARVTIEGIGTFGPGESIKIPPGKHKVTSTEEARLSTCWGGHWVDPMKGPRRPLFRGHYL